MTIDRTIHGLLLPYGVMPDGDCWTSRTFLNVRRAQLLHRTMGGRLQVIGRVDAVDRCPDGWRVTGTLRDDESGLQALQEAQDGYLPFLEPIVRVVDRRPLPGHVSEAARRMMGRAEVRAAVLLGVRMEALSMTASPHAVLHRAGVITFVPSSPPIASATKR